MKNINVCLLAAVTCMYSVQATAKFVKRDLNFVIESNVFSLHGSLDKSHKITPLELNPINNSKSVIKLAAVCAVGKENCSGIGFGSGSGYIDLDNDKLCKDAGYKLTRNCESGAKPADLCPYNNAFFKSCDCDTSYYTQSGAYTNQCGTLVNVETCKTSNANQYYRCTCDMSMVTKCNSSNQYVAAGAEICRDSLSGDYVSNISCKKCTPLQL